MMATTTTTTAVTPDWAALVQVIAAAEECDGGDVSAVSAASAASSASAGASDADAAPSDPSAAHAHATRATLVASAASAALTALLAQLRADVIALVAGEFERVSSAVAAVPCPGSASAARRVGYRVAQALFAEACEARRLAEGAVALPPAVLTACTTPVCALTPADKKMLRIAWSRGPMGMLRAALRRRRATVVSRQAKQTLAKYTEATMAALATSPHPVSPAVARPRPMPVTVPPPAVFNDVLTALRQDALQCTDALRGRLFPDGRLDLCKQVVGPDSAVSTTLFDALRLTRHVRHFLLGNNIAGGAFVAALVAFLAEPPTPGSPPIHTWYLAGNEIDALGADALTSALVAAQPGTRASDVRYLWLKRNPCGSAPLLPLVAAATAPPSLRLLDLQQTGLGDDGVVALASALRDNTTLRTLYVDGVGMRANGAVALAAVLNDTALRNVYVSMNAFGDEGAVALAAALKANPRLKRFSASSCGLGARGGALLLDAARDHPTLLCLDVGYYRATVGIGELPNVLGDGVVDAAVNLLAHSPRLRALSLMRCGLSEAGVARIIDAALTHPALLWINVRQLNWCVAKPLADALKARGAAIAEATLPLGHKWRQSADAVMRLNAVAHIRSVYRGKM